MKLTKSLVKKFGFQEVAPFVYKRDGLSLFVYRGNVSLNGDAPWDFDIKTVERLQDVYRAFTGKYMTNI